MVVVVCVREGSETDLRDLCDLKELAWLEWREEATQLLQSYNTKKKRALLVRAGIALVVVTVACRLVYKLKK
jgi:hypothetical protein